MRVSLAPPLRATALRAAIVALGLWAQAATAHEGHDHGSDTHPPPR